MTPIALAAGLVFAVSAADAHSVGWSLAPDAEAVVIEFNYGGSEPMAFAEVTVTAPDGRVFQKGRADREGHFAFVAPLDSPVGGVWVVDASDAEGHALRAEVTPASPERAAAAKRVGGDILGWFGLASVLVSAALAGAYFDERGRRIRATRAQPPIG